MFKHVPVEGDHKDCGPNCTITGDMCCGGHVPEQCKLCDFQYKYFGWWLTFRLLVGSVVCATTKTHKLQATLWGGPDKGGEDIECTRCGEFWHNVYY